MRWIGSWHFYVGVIILFVISACNRYVDNASHENTFDLEGFIDSQVIFLSANKFGVRKVTRLGLKEDEVEQYPDSAGWVKELNIIRTANINKPGLRPYYDLQSVDSSMFHIDTYILIDTGRANTLYQKIYRSKDDGSLEKIRIRQRVDNPIYSSGRDIEVALKRREGDDVIDSILIHGYQKMVLLDTAFYQTITSIIR
jgi:hypothetical protein